MVLKKSLLFILAFYAAPLMCCQEVNSTRDQPVYRRMLATLSPYGKTINRYARPARLIITDLSVAYCLAMGTTLAHELGHALTGKLFWGTPLDITIGSYNETYHIASLGGIGLGGFNPLYGKTMHTINGDVAIYAYAIMLAAGPVCGACFNMLAIKLINKLRFKPVSLTTNIWSFVNQAANLCYPIQNNDSQVLMHL